MVAAPCVRGPAGHLQILDRLARAQYDFARRPSVPRALERHRPQGLAPISPVSSRINGQEIAVPCLQFLRPGRIRHQARRCGGRQRHVAQLAGVPTQVVREPLLLELALILGGVPLPIIPNHLVVRRVHHLERHDVDAWPQRLGGDDDIRELTLARGHRLLVVFRHPAAGDDLALAGDKRGFGIRVRQRGGTGLGHTRPGDFLPIDGDNQAPVVGHREFEILSACQVRDFKTCPGAQVRQIGCARRSADVIAQPRAVVKLRLDPIRRRRRRLAIQPLVLRREGRHPGLELDHRRAQHLVDAPDALGVQHHYRRAVCGRLRRLAPGRAPAPSPSTPSAAPTTPSPPRPLAIVPWKLPFNAD